MTLVDVNLLIYAHRKETAAHAKALAWLTARAHSPEAFGVCDLVLSGFLRIVTHPRIFHHPSSLDEAFQFTGEIQGLHNYVPVNPGPRHWNIFAGLCLRSNARGNLIPDAYLAAIAIESGSEWLTTDRGFARFHGLRWRNPLE
ncbi:MAG: type II toxin-antitoxin system VapC family toxin [Candidatus Solibacter usitatus]|nr:type II toxin-antitoxin system VapC family toxin [Candidatus Solibacter usitatus]